MADVKDILPPNVTTLERDLFDAASMSGVVDPALGIMRLAKLVDIPDSYLPFLIYEYGLGELLPFLTDPREAIAEGVKWQRYRGTPAALTTALSWVGITEVEVEEEPPGVKFAEFQLKLGDIPSGANVDDILSIVDLSVPVRSRLSRIYNEHYDIRRFIFSTENHIPEWGDLLSDYSGVFLEEGGPKQSFGRLFGYLVDWYDGLVYPAFGATRQFGFSAYFDNAYRLSVSFFGDTPWHNPNPFIVHGKHWSFGTGGVYNDDGFMFDEPTDFLPRRSFAKSLLVLSDRWVFDDLHAVLSGCRYIKETGGVMELSDNEENDLWGGNLWKTEYAEILERFHNTYKYSNTGVVNFETGFNAITRKHVYTSSRVTDWPVFSEPFEYKVFDIRKVMTVSAFVAVYDHDPAHAGWHHIDDEWGVKPMPLVIFAYTRV